MKIRTKLALEGLLLCVGFTIAILVIIISGSSIINLMHFEAQSERVLAKLNTIEAQNSTFLTTSKKLTVIKHDWQESIEDFEISLETLLSERAIGLFSNEQKRELERSEGMWEQVYSWYFEPIFKLVDTIIDSELAEIIGNNSILRTKIMILESKGDDASFPGKLLSLENYQDLIREGTEDFKGKLTNLLEGTKQQADRYIKMSIYISIILVIITIIISIIISAKISNRIASRINLVEDAIQTVSKGDFSKELNIKSGDEFETLSDNYNILIKDLWKKLDTVKDFMLKVGASATENLDLKKAYQIIIDSAVDNTESDAGALFIVDRQDNLIQVSAVSGLFPPPYLLPQQVVTLKERTIKEHFNDRTFKMGETIIGETIQSGVPVFIKISENDERLIYNTYSAKGILYISSLIIVPLIISNQILGAVAIVRKNEDKRFTDLDFSHVKTFCDYAALTINNVLNYDALIEKKEMDREIGIAADIQKNLLPRSIPNFNNASFASFSNVVEGISGDYHDIFRLDDNNIAVVICDVAGKGVPAALVMVMIRTIIRLIASPKRGAANVLSIINKSITGRIGMERYATMGYFIFNEKDREIMYSNAAHSPLFVYRKKTGEFQQIDTLGLPIGIEKKQVYKQKNFTGEVGDLLFLFTDGIPEAKNANNEEYSQDRMLSIIKDNTEFETEELVRVVKEDLRQFVGEAIQYDDQTLLVMRIE
ncbi:MAG: SpoIIE family protein phosphatase [Spirochaetales bacterium]|nr:SpoIIE family protein phosphatase [Spirochaetales bacterium]